MFTLKEVRLRGSQVTFTFEAFVLTFNSANARTIVQKALSNYFVSYPHITYLHVYIVSDECYILLLCRNLYNKCRHHCDVILISPTKI